MLSIEEIKLLIEKLEKVKKEDLQQLIDSNLKILKDIALAVDANNDQVINRLDKTPEWYNKDREEKLLKPTVDPITARQVQSKIFQFAKTNIYNSLEIGPGNGMFSTDFRAWRLNYFLDITHSVSKEILKKFDKNKFTEKYGRPPMQKEVNEILGGGSRRQIRNTKTNARNLLSEFTR